MERKEEALFVRVFNQGDRRGLRDPARGTLLPAEYDSIFLCAEQGFVLVSGGKFGFIQFAGDGLVKAFLPCLYDYITPKEHGLSLHQRSENEAERVDWFELRTGRLYRNMCHQRSFRHYDSFLHMDVGATMPFLKKAGKEQYINLPTDTPIDILYEIPVDGEADYFICCEFEPTDDELGFQYSYFLLTAFGEQFTVSRSYTEMNGIYNDLPSIIKEAQKWIEKTKK